MELPEGTRMFQLLTSLREGACTAAVGLVGTLLLVNQSRADLETILKEDDEVFIFDVPGG